MRRFCACLLALVLVVSAVGAGSEKAKKDLAALQGTWEVKTLEYDGKDLTGEHKLSFVFKGDTATVQGDPKVKKEYAKVKFKLDPTTNPPCADLTVTAGVQIDATMEGIYELKGDELKLCVRVIGNDRPLKFESPAGSSTALVTMKRQK
jgi:uncharacterized protein (TIGR03067 family)